ncbi:MAG: ATP-binding protein, partial [Pseudomonadota bacterium]
PHSLDNDQLENATTLANAGAAWCIEQKDLNIERLTAASRRLKQSHKELQEFAYAVSHALQEPMRTVSTASVELQRDLRGTLHDQQRELLDHVGQAACRAGRMVLGLLEFSRVLTRGVAPQPTSSANACHEATELLKGLIESSDAEIAVRDLPQVTADHEQLVRVFYHLIENAIQFSPRPAYVRVTCEPSAEVFTFAVRDTGYGISSRDLPRVFQVFARAAEEDGVVTEGKGIGAGLPICRRIIERHGGRIWLDSTVQRGTTVLFTLPRVAVVS